MTEMTVIPIRCCRRRRFQTALHHRAVAHFGLVPRRAVYVGLVLLSAMAFQPLVLM